MASRFASVLPLNVIGLFYVMIAISWLSGGVVLFVLPLPVLGR